jgi:hypothetical protein
LSGGKKLTFKDGYLRPVKSTEIVNKKYAYRVLLLTDNKGKNIIFKDGCSILTHLSDGRLSKVLYYFLLNNSTPIDLSNVDPKSPPTWASHLGNVQIDDTTHIFKQGLRSFIVLQEEDFNRVSVYDSTQ